MENLGHFLCKVLDDFLAADPCGDFYKMRLGYCVIFSQQILVVIFAKRAWHLSSIWSGLRPDHGDSQSYSAPQGAGVFNTQIPAVLLLLTAVRILGEDFARGGD